MTGRPLDLALTAACAAALLAFALPPAARAEPDPAIPVIESFDAGLLEAMKAGRAAGIEGRFRRLLPVVDRTFDLETMMRFAVGADWTSFSAAEREGLVKAFGRLTAANLAHNFDDFNGERIKVNPEVQVRGPDRLVRTELLDAKGEATALNYRMRKAAGGWRVIDIYYGAVSQLTAQRSDFTSTLASGGAAALLRSLEAKTAALMKP